MELLRRARGRNRRPDSLARRSTRLHLSLHFSLHRWLQCFKTCEAHQTLHVRRFQLVEPGHVYAKYVWRPTTGITRAERSFLYAFVVLGKVRQPRRMTSNVII